MEQQYPPTPPIPPPSKEWTWKETLSVVFLVLLPIVGLILMWAIANWSKKVKIIITLVLLLPIIAIGILSGAVLITLEEAREAARDAKRMADMRQIAIAQDMYYAENDVYYTSVNYPPSIGGYLAETPTDPKTEAPYGWIDNTGDNQKFCVYADLERNGFYVASHTGVGEIAVEPRTLSDCENLPDLRFPGF